MNTQTTTPYFHYKLGVVRLRRTRFWTTWLLNRFWDRIQDPQRLA